MSYDIHKFFSLKKLSKKPIITRMSYKEKSAIQIKLSKEILSPRSRVFAKLLRMNDFQKFVPSVKESKVLEKGKNTALMKWHVEIAGFPIKWAERNIVNRRQGTISFKAIDGDLHQFEGKWKVTGDQNHSKIEINAKIDTGIPFLEKLVGDILKNKVTQIFEEMFRQIEREVREDFYRANLPTRNLSGYAVIGHHYNFQHMLRYLHSFNPHMKMPSREFLGKLFDMTPPHKACDILPIEATSGRKAFGHFVICPIIPEMLDVDLEAVFNRVIEAIRVAESYRAGIVTLGGFTSIAGERFGKEIPKLVSIPVTTGNTYTSALAIEGVIKGCERMGISLPLAKLAVVGGSGDIGSACARVLAEKVKHVTLVARNIERLRIEQGNIERLGKATVDISSDVNMAIADADIVIAAASATHSFMDPNNFKSGAVICDIGYPKNIASIAKDRKDLLIFAGGLSSLPSDFKLDASFDYGLPTRKILYGCFAEAILLDLEKKYESFSYGKGSITKEKIDTILAIAHKHGFGLSPFFWGDRLMGEQEFETIRGNVKVN